MARWRQHVILTHHAITPLPLAALIQDTSAHRGVDMRIRLLSGMYCVMLAASPVYGEQGVGTPASDAARHGRLSRVDFNRRAAELFLPLFWRNDANGNGNLEPGELAILVGYPNSDRHIWLERSGGFTAAFDTAYGQMLQSDQPVKDPAERTRRRLVVEELAQGRPTLVETDLSQSTAAEKNMVEHLMTAARLIERIYARQKGVFGLDVKIPAEDTASRALFHRNQSPFCEAPKTENQKACNALRTPPARAVGLYPAKIQGDSKFCDALAAAPNSAELMGHFSVVADGGQPGSYRAVPYSQAYEADMEAVATELAAAASGLGNDEAALKHYLLTTATSFRTNDWEPANVAWVAMNAHNSKWYVRIAPDEVYYEPCAWKAGFALQLARINRESIEWQRKLDPLKNEMERTLAAMAKKPYQARQVNFKVPDFIDVVLNAADQRNAHGATIGQSLPNWGPTADRGGRTVAMTNLYTDADSRATATKQMSALFCKSTNAWATTGRQESLIASLLHEVAHNLGPAHEYKVNGKEDSAVFGGPMASTLEELKAQTSSMYLVDWLAGKGLFTPADVKKIQLRDVAWMFGHISRGMYGADGTPKNYSQLSAMQLGSFVRAGAITWKADEVAANGSDRGCLNVDFNALGDAVKTLETTVLEIKASGDKARAEQMKADFVDSKGDFSALRAAITERWLRAPKASFVYSVNLGSEFPPPR